MLNCTSRKQVEKVFPIFVKRWPTPRDFMSANKEDVIETCKSLGFANRRTDNLLKMTERFLAGPWSDVRELPGVGEYAARSYEIFCLNDVGTTCPKDHALTQYYEWATSSVVIDAVIVQKLSDDVLVDAEPKALTLRFDEGDDALERPVVVEAPAA